MRICRFDDNRVGVVIGEKVADVTDVVTEALPPQRWPLQRGDAFIAALPALRERLEEAASRAPLTPLDQVRLLSPVANPGKIIAAPVNYMKHVEESREDAGINFGTEISLIDRYALFLKANSSLVGAGEGVEIHHDDGRRTDHEVELALVIGKKARKVSEQEALECIAGYFIGLDITIRGTEDRSYRKSLDTFTVLGPWLVTADEFGSPESVELDIKVNDEPRQHANTQDLIWSVARIISFASHSYTLEPGDVILTGTPEGVAPIKRGDRMDAWIEGIGAMRVQVR
ncbi:fumarylacetoacetate hydrolase family protein [Alloalcanivorax marinus]|uniref:fumarylacetoacetate hydrolase family protein n=1 Tax=Alloalcanivorax marinus TaxID=1177169 RepID=UPI0019314DE6|nr:fumarylacetoacetate hydrolase family protein [Alloalcanivorax marinus]MBL7249660.1 fumarylacetoacetate hydrolase family protein [Alloalcanivorax marinus]